MKLIKWTKFNFMNMSLFVEFHFDENFIILSPYLGNSIVLPHARTVIGTHRSIYRNNTTKDIIVCVTLFYNWDIWYIGFQFLITGVDFLYTPRMT